MSEFKNVDARGRSCPEPVLMTENALKKMKKGEVEVLVDTNTSKENVTRMAKHQGWSVEDQRQPDGSFKLILRK
jgi:tRNA 2-thiouridine synthesizing protein A